MVFILTFARDDVRLRVKASPADIFIGINAMCYSYTRSSAEAL